MVGRSRVGPQRGCRVRADRPRIGLLAVRFSLFDAAMPPDFPAGRRHYAQQAAALLAEIGDVVAPGVVEDETTAAAAVAQLAEAGVDAVVFWPTMAAPPSWLDDLLDALPSVPVIVVVAQEAATVPDDYDTDQATARSLPVGAVMGTNVLARRQRPFDVVVGQLGSELTEAIGRAVRAATTAAHIRRLRLGVIGAPIDGYTDVQVTPAQLDELGVTTVDLGDQLVDAFEQVTPDDGQLLLDELADDWTASAPAPVLERGARLAVALERLVRDHQLDGGAVNCHGPRLRFDPRIGITACLGVSRCSAQGRPFACTGDIPTAVALALGRRLAGAALYCELYQLDLERDWILVANGGEGDWSYRDRARPAALLAEDHYAGAAGAGVAVSFAIPSGPATLISLSPEAGDGGRWRLVSASGTVLGSDHPTMEGPNAMFRFDGLGVADAYARWCRAGATHHAALLPGDQLDDLARVASILGIDHRSVAEDT